MRCAWHIISFLIHDALYRDRNIIPVRAHDLDRFPDRKLVALFNPIEPFLILLSYNAKICVFLLIGVIIIDLSFLGRFSKEKSGRKMTVGTV